jgi:xylulokinase
MLWLKEQQPCIWGRTHKLLDVADYLVHRLTGNFVTSFDRAHVTWLFDARTKKKEWSAELVKRTGLSRALLPDIMKASAPAGGLRATAAQELGLRADTPVAAGLGDLAAAALAAGATGGAPHLNIGTSSWLGAHVPRSRVNPLTGIGSLCGADGGDYLLIATQENAGVCVKWALSALGYGASDFAAFEAEASAIRPHAGAPMFFPWLSGERVPVDDKTLRGGFLNLSLDSPRGALARAVYEGVALNMRWAMGDFDRLAGAAGKPLRLVGGGAASALWCQIFADALGRDLELVEGYELAGARGAAMTAAVLAQWHPDLAAAAGSVKTIKRFTPDPATGPLYAERFAQFKSAFKRLQPYYHRLHKG